MGRRSGASIMTFHPQQCSDTQLALLLLSENDGLEEGRATVDHLESCPKCQLRLSDFAADRSWWNDAKAFLSAEFEYREKPDLSQSRDSTPERPDRHSSIDASLRNVLGTPNHPEMLGRLGRYDIERIIGSGGMGIVLKAHDSELNRPIAIKLLAAHLAHVGAARERFAREARAAAAVVHEHVVAIYNVESDGSNPFLVMQYVPGRSLQARVDEDGPLTTEEILRIGMQAAAGLAAAHAQGLVHRDVKPSNILLEESVDRAVLTDFGLARTMDDASLTQTGVLAGTPHYMSPEQATGEAIDHRSDLFSLGAVLYFMATGHPPFRADGALAVLHRICREPHRPIWQSNVEIPDELCGLVDRLLEKKPNKRFASAKDAEEKLASLLSRAQRYGLTSRRRFRSIRPWSFSRKAIWTALVTLVIASTIAAIVTYDIWPRSEVKSNRATGGVDPAAVAASEQDYRTEINRTRIEIGELENASSVLRGADSWRQELESLKHELNVLEKQEYPNLKNEGAK
jgi:eukaryotic-like serine/threonine-protein kinase